MLTLLRKIIRAFYLFIFCNVLPLDNREPKATLQTITTYWEVILRLFNSIAKKVVKELSQTIKQITEN